MPCVLATVVVGAVHDHVGLAGAHERLATDGQRQLGHLALVDEAAAGGVHVQAAKEPVTPVLVVVLPLGGKGPALGRLGHRAALVTQHREGAVEHAAGVEHHLDARAVAHGVAQREHRGVKVLALHGLVAEESAGAHHGGLGQNVGHRAVDVDLHARGHAVFHEHGIDVGPVDDGGTQALNLLGQRLGTAQTVGQDEVAAAKAHAVGVAPQLHGHAQLLHLVDSGAGTRKHILEELGIHRGVREAVHVLEHVVERHPLALGLLDAGLAGVGAAALGKVGRRGARALLKQTHVVAELGGVQGGHEARGAGAHHGHIALDGGGAPRRLGARSCRGGRRRPEGRPCPHRPKR